MIQNVEVQVSLVFMKGAHLHVSEFMSQLLIYIWTGVVIPQAQLMKDMFHIYQQCVDQSER